MLDSARPKDANGDDQTKKRGYCVAAAITDSESRMRMLIRAYSVAAILIFALTTGLPVYAQKRIEDRFANVNGIRLHYLTAGKGDPVILLHGYAENSHMWRPFIAELAKSHTVIAPDLRCFGQSSKPMTGYDKKTGRRHQGQRSLVDGGSAG